MTLLDNRRLLRSVVKLTNILDIRAFEAALIATLTESISARAIKLCRLRENPDVPGQNTVVYISSTEPETSKHDKKKPVLLENDEALADCFRTQRRVVVANARPESGVRTIHPLWMANEIIGFLVIESETDDAKDQELVSILLGFYKNFVSLLNDSQRDKLTGLHNRTTFHEQVLRIIASRRSAKDRSPGAHEGHCLAILDIDHFKRINDKFGHLYGDEVLLLFARTMVDAFRGGDLLFRIGGEEFVIVLGGIDMDRALLVFDRFRQTVENYPFPQVGKITVSLGVCLISGEDSPDAVIDRADQALYYAKKNGRNQVCVYEKLVAEGKLTPSKRESGVELF
jgi:diguanylate cyclase (GGDEF)-like protein